mgnify:FL=1
MHICISPPLMLRMTLSYDCIIAALLNIIVSICKIVQLILTFKKKKIKILETHRKEKTPLTRCFPIKTYL